MTAFSTVQFLPLLPLWLLGALAAVCVLALAPALWRRARGSLLRLACFAVVLLWLTGPRLIRETRGANGAHTPLATHPRAFSTAGARTTRRYSKKVLPVKALGAIIRATLCAWTLRCETRS